MHKLLQAPCNSAPVSEAPATVRALPLQRLSFTWPGTKQASNNTLPAQEG
jgi:hypothetical protein